MNELKIIFCGDYAPCGGFEQVAISKEVNMFGDALPIIQTSDLSFVNLECPLTEYKQHIKKVGPALKAHPLCINALKHFDVVGLANNHILDFGSKGLKDTLNACHSIGLSTVGAGLDLKSAQKPYIQEVKGLKVAIIAIAEYEFNQSEGGGAGSAPIDPIDNYNQIKSAQEHADIVLVTIHGGNEYFPYPRPGLRKLCKHFVDLGVEAVICHHPHVPGAYEYHKGKPIIYSLGNFVFDAIKPPKDWELGYLASLKFDTKNKVFESLELIPYRQSVELGGVKLLSGDEKTALLHRVDSYKQLLDDNEGWLNEWEKFVALRANDYIVKHFSPLSFRGLGFLARNTPISKFFFNIKKDLFKLNVLRCQSHREMLVSAIELKKKMRH